MEVSWFALTNDSECKQKGSRSVLISLGMNITRAPGSLCRKLQCLIPNVKLEIDPAIIHQHLLHLHDWTNCHKTTIASIVPLLSYVLMDINLNNVEKLEGLPLILNDAGNLEQITLKHPLYCCEFIDLLPHCKESFISSTLYKETELYTKLVTLKLIKPLDATFVAAHIDHSNDKIKYCGHEKIVCCLWRFILDSHFDFSEAMEILKDISCIPVNIGYIYPPRELEFILYNYGQVHLLQKLKLPVLYLKLLPKSRDIAKLTWELKPFLADSYKPEEVLIVLDHSTIPNDYPCSLSESRDFMTFVQESDNLTTKVDTLKQLRLYQTFSGTFVSANNLIHVVSERFPTVGLSQKEISDSHNVKLCKMYPECQLF